MGTTMVQTNLVDLSRQRDRVARLKLRLAVLRAQSRHVQDDLRSAEMVLEILEEGMPNVCDGDDVEIDW